MSSSKLGALPEFGETRRLSSRSAYDSAQLNLDDALGSLLDDSTSTTRSNKKQPKKSKTKTKSSNSRIKGSNSDSNFYSQLADQTKDSFDDSDDMVEITPVDTKKMAESVDVDDMEASLFGSFSQSQNQRRQLTSLGKKNANFLPSTDPEPIAAKRATTVEQKDTPTNDVGLPQPPQKSVQKEKPPSKKFNLDDDLLDLLSDSDSEDKAPKKRVKPKIQLKTTLKVDDSKPITSSSSIATEHNEPDIERPKTSHGHLSQSDGFSSTQPLETSGKVDILKLDSTPEHSESSHHNTSKTLGESSIDFGNDDNDILSGMGLDDSKTTSVSTKRQGSRLDELLGKKKPSIVEGNKQFTGLADDKGMKGDDEDTFQFGGYLPSVATDSSIGQNSKLSSARRRKNSDSLTLRPGSAPGPGKKTVRFAEGVEDDNRPSSSPAMNDTPKPALKTSKRTSSQEQDSKPKDGSASFSGKPPLPRKSEATSLTVDSKGQSEVIERPPDDKDKTKPESNAAGGEESLVDNNDSLFPWHESTPKQSSSRTRGRRSSQQKSFSSSLFEDESRHQLEEDQVSIGNQTNTQESISKLERPTFPWQKGRQSRSHSTGAVGSRDTTNVMLSTTNKSLETPHQSVLDQSSLMASFQEQLLQQQKQMQEQFKTLQSHQTAVSLKGQSNEEDRLRLELKNAQKRMQEVEKLVEEQKSQLSAKQATIDELQINVQTSGVDRKKLEEEYKVLSDKIGDLESSHQKSQLELQTQLEELKMKLYKVELERDQLKQSIESTRLHHTEEMESVQKSHDTRIKAMEESFQRREARWREEAEMESSRYQERLQQLENEKTDTVLALKKKLDALEVSKTNEIGRLQDIHYSSVEDLKREHELDKQHLVSLHRQEVEALKAAHSHTRMLSDLSRQVESSTREVSQLQAKLESTHSMEMQEQIQRAKTHEEQLKTLEERLMRQQAENTAERERLQSLIAKLEVNISQQRKQIEQERWELQQESNHLKVQQKAFEEERITSIRRLEEDKDTLQQAKERFLTEQREVLTKCYEERRTLASEKAELTVLQKRMQEKEQLTSTKNMQVEAECEASLAQIKEESARIATESRQLKQDQQILKVEQASLDKDRVKLEQFNAELQKRSQEIEEMHQSAVIMRENGEQALIEAHKLQEQLAQQSHNMQSNWTELREQEKRVATEFLSLAHQKRELQQLRLGSRLTAIPSVESVHSLDQLYLPPHQHNTGSEPTPTHSSSHLPFTPTEVATNYHTSRLTVGSHHLPTNVSAPPLTAGRNESSGGCVYSPRASPVHTMPYDLLGVPHPHPSVKTTLAAIKQSRSLRNLELDARKDKEDLEEENEFLESLQLQNSNVKQLVW